MIAFVSTDQVTPLRRSVLRVGMPDATVDFDGDDDPGTFHLAVLDDDGTIIAVSTWMLRPRPDEPDRPSFQLRGMASAVRSSGHGSALIRFGIDRVRSLGVTRVWANARDSALEFYLRHGFVSLGEGFIESVTRLPHHVVSLDL